MKFYDKFNFQDDLFFSSDAQFLKIGHYINSQNTIISLEDIDFGLILWEPILSILFPLKTWQHILPALEY